MVYLLKTRAPFQGAAFLVLGGDSAAALLGESGNEDLNDRRLAQGLGLVGALPGHVDVRAAEVAVGGRLTIDGLLQIEHGDDAARTSTCPGSAPTRPRPCARRRAFKSSLPLSPRSAAAESPPGSRKAAP